MDVLIDANIILDVLMQRKTFIENSKQILQMCNSGKINGFVAAHSVTTMWYVMRKEFPDEERRDLLRNLFLSCNIAPVGEAEVLSALDRDDFSDFEDCVQDECAAAIHARYIITRNKADFAKSKIPALLPEEFITLVG